MRPSNSLSYKTNQQYPFKRTFNSLNFNFHSHLHASAISILQKIILVYWDTSHGIWVNLEMHEKQMSNKNNIKMQTVHIYIWFTWPGKWPLPEYACFCSNKIRWRNKCANLIFSVCVCVSCTTNAWINLICIYSL